MLCAKCNRHISDDSRFCSQCGNPTAVEATNRNVNVARCSNCGAWFPGGDAKCPSCYCVAYKTDPLPEEQSPKYLSDDPSNISTPKQSSTNNKPSPIPPKTDHSNTIIIVIILAIIFGVGECRDFKQAKKLGDIYKSQQNRYR